MKRPALRHHFHQEGAQFMMPHKSRVVQFMMPHKSGVVQFMMHYKSGVVQFVMLPIQEGHPNFLFFSFLKPTSLEKNFITHTVNNHVDKVILFQM